MYLKQIKALGFKSFADEVNIEMSKNITGIVGPNGSGKSNVVDAIKWVLGEQSIKNLRGEGAMSDIIFSGSSKRKSANFSSVTLVFDNSDKHLPIDYSEVSIKRTLYKDGENEYYLNNNKCRLKDILELIIDSGIEKDSLNIIGQGEIQNIINNKNGDRRIIFDSAAGVLKYKKRKEEAIKKLEKTHDNLSRVNDIINELETQIKPLKEQKDVAKKYLEVKSELEKLDVSVITKKITEINASYNNHKEELNILNKKLANINTINVDEDATLVSKRTELIKIDKSIQELNKSLIEVSSNVEKLKGEKALLLERVKNSNENDKIRLEKEEEILSLNNKLDLLNKNIDSNNSKINDIKNNIKNIEDKIKQLNNNKKMSNDDLKILNRKYNDLGYKIDILNNEIETYSSVSFPVKNILNNNNLNGIHNIIANVIEFDEKYVDAINIALTSSKEFIITDTVEDAKSAIKYLKDNNLGRATFYPIDTIKARFIDDNSLDIIRNTDGFINIASNIVKYNKIYQNIILNQLGTIIIARDLSSAHVISKKINQKYRIVTLDGDVVNVGGSLTGGRARKQSSNIFSKKYEVEECIRQKGYTEKQIKELEENINEIDYNLNNLNSELLNLEINKSKLDSVNEQSRLDVISTNMEIKEKEKDIKHYTIDSDSIEDELVKKYYTEINKKNNITKDLDDINLVKEKLNNEIEQLEINIKKSNNIINKMVEDSKNLEIKINSESIQLDNLLNTLNIEYNITYEKAYQTYYLEDNIEEAEENVKKLKNIIKNLGVVNLGAIDEYDRINSRFDFLNSQKSDLYKAESTLIDIINEMDKVMKEEFINTFNKIKENFVVEFRKLFGGGNADLILTEPDNILETGIEIDVCPPGKKLSHISLLSGGEKTLTAISLLFAIIKVKNLPFCVLDEVEAALDEVNVDKFGEELNVLKEDTQFIIITHKKKTMEYVDYLYGITMQESGVSKLVSVNLKDLEDEIGR